MSVDLPHDGTPHVPTTLRMALADAEPLFVLPKDPLVSRVLVPALRSSTALDVMMGYFSSSSFAEIAPGLATFLRNAGAPLRIIVSPFLTDADFEVLAQDPSYVVALARRLLIDEVPDEHHLVRHTLECLAWLITEERLVLKIAVMRDALVPPQGLALSR